MGAARPSSASERAKTRHWQASQIGAVDAILCLPGRIWLETMKVGLQTRRVYLWVRSQLASWALGLVTSTIVMAYLLVPSSGEALIFIWTQLIFALAMIMAFLLGERGLFTIPAPSLILAHRWHLKPGELRCLRPKCIVPAVLGGTWRVVLTLHLTEMLRASITGECDETVIGDLEQVAKTLSRRGSQVPDRATTFLDVSMRSLQQLASEAQQRLGLVATLQRQILFVLRHSGVSAVSWHKGRMIDEIPKRER